ncbi:hypothetical protein H4217_001424 [Coemansia sp. RSA 1939]|nr:hypothetical protein H4217_001424 [Coemansia sp. RSA 1939]KAJ2609801.1 hypothetical protein EV177_004283 [Coemansia sp. RSA 1804]
MKWHIQILSPNTHNTRSTSVLVFFPTTRYLFNCGEGTQRLSFENNVRVSKVSAVFLSRVDWESMGGLPGMLLTLADSGMKGIAVNGGRNLTHALAAARHFILRSDMGLSVNEMLDTDASADFRDSNVHIVPVHAYPSSSAAADEEQACNSCESDSHNIRRQLVTRAFGHPKQPDISGPKSRLVAKKNKQQQQQQQMKKKGYYGNDDKCSGSAVEEHLQNLQKAEEEALEKKRAHSPEASGRNGMGKLGMLLPQTTPSLASLSFILEGPVVAGKFDLNAAVALGLPPGPLYSRLKSGESVVGPNGNTIHPSQCVGPPTPGSIVIIIDCPSVDYIESLIANPKFTPFLEEGAENKSRQSQLAIIVHGLGPGVSQDKRYQDWARRFPAHVHHVVSSPELVPDTNPFQRHLRVQAAIAAVDNNTFVLPQSSSASDLPLSSFMTGKNVHVAEHNAIYEIVPKFRIDLSTIPQLLSPEAMYKTAKASLRSSIQGRTRGLITDTAASQDDDASSDTRTVSDTDLVLCPIGTGSSVPSLYRNVSANIISIKGYGGIVLDCGESTVSLLKRFLGYPHRNIYNKKVDLDYVGFVVSLKMLYISHMHADHHLGAVLLLREWSQLTKSLPSPLPRLTIVAPWRFWAWIQDISGVQDIGLDRLDFVGCQELRILDTPQADPETLKATNVLKAKLGLTEISTCFVVHCPWAYGLSITHKNGWRVVYSGDTRPCTNLVTLGRAGNKPPTVLLHEATHSDDLIKDAIAKRHTTVSEAVAMALGMRAENLLLTHFSQRCLNIPNWKTKNVLDVKLPRYGHIANYTLRRFDKDGYRSTTASEAADDIKEDTLEQDQEDQDVDAFDISEDVGADMTAANDGPMLTDDINAAKEELLKEMDDLGSDNGSEDTDSSDRSSQNSTDNAIQGRISANLNVAVAFDMSAFGASDFVRYRRNVKLLRRAAWEEIQLFIAEEQKAPMDEKIVEQKTDRKNGSHKKPLLSKKYSSIRKGKRN